MELQKLRYFVQIAREHNYTRAAARLYVSQPALSKAMKILEDEFGVPLLDTRADGVFLTDYGQHLYEHAIHILNEVDALPNIIQDVQQIRTGTLSIGVTPMLNALFLEDIVVDFSNKYPDVELKIIEGGSRIVRQHLADGLVDIAFCIVDSTHDCLEDYILFEDSMVACISENHPFAQCSVLKFEQLQNIPFNIYSTASTLYTRIMERCTLAGFEPKINFSSSKISNLLQMTARGKGVFILPRPYAEYALSPGLKLIPIDDTFPWTACLAKNKQVYQTFVSKTFESYVIDLFQNNPPANLKGGPASSR